MNFELIDEPDFLRCVVTGTYDVREAIGGFPQIIARCRAQGLDRVLIDYRQMDGRPSAIEKMVFSEETVNLHEQHVSVGGVPIRIAFLGSAAVVTSYNPGLELARNRGFSTVTVTADAEAAMAFLTEDGDG